MVTWGEAQSWDAAALEPVISAVGKAQERLLAQADEAKASVVPAGWTGTAAVAAAGKLRRVGDAAELVAAELAATKRAVTEATDSITGLRSGMAEAQELARRYGFTITESGAVPPQPCTAGTPLDVVEHQRRIRLELIDRVEQTVRHANDIDSDLTGVLRSILDGDLVDVTTNNQRGETRVAAYVPVGATAGTLSELRPPTDATPGDNAAWWATLSERARAEFVTDHPELVGPRDGLPTVARDAANRELLRAIEHRMRQRFNRLWQELTRSPDVPRAIARIAAVAGKLGGIDAVRRRLTRTADAPPGERYYLLAVDPGGDGRVIVAKGNPDIARHVTTYVPGTGSGLARIEVAMGRSAAMFRAADDATPPEAAPSVITWVGYDAPDDLLDALSAGYANRARGELDSFQAGLRASHDDSLPPAHNTVLGHSYGATVVGFAARDDGIAADDLVFVAAPGIGVDRAEALNVPGARVWATSDPEDPVGDTEIFGNDPTDVDFGALRFESDSPTVQATWYAPETHSDYWEVGNPSLRAIGDIIAGVASGLAAAGARGPSAASQA